MVHLQKQADFLLKKLDKDLVKPGTKFTVGIPTEALFMTEDGFYLKCQKAQITPYNLYSVPDKKDPDTNLLNCPKQHPSAFFLLF